MYRFGKQIWTEQCTVYIQLHIAILHLAFYWLHMRQYTRHIYRVLLYGISVHLNIYQGFLLANDKIVYSKIF